MAAADRSDLDLVSLQLTIGKTPLRVAAPLRVPQRNNDGMIALGLILLVLVAVLVIAIVVSNPQTYTLSIFGAVIPANGAASSSPALSPWRSPSWLCCCSVLVCGARRGKQ